MAVVTLDRPDKLNTGDHGFDVVAGLGCIGCIGYCAYGPALATVATDIVLAQRVNNPGGH